MTRERMTPELEAATAALYAALREPETPEPLLRKLRDALVVLMDRIKPVNRPKQAPEALGVLELAGSVLGD